MKLQEKAMLTKLSISAWSISKKDKNGSEAVQREFNCAGDSGNYRKYIVGKEAFKPVQKIISAARTWNYENSLPWCDEGFRIQTADNFESYMAKMREFKTEIENSVETFCAALPEEIDKARQSLGGLFNPADYPEPEQIRQKFRFEIDVRPLPDAADFRVSLSDDEKNNIKTSIENRLTTATANAMRDLWQRLFEAVNHMAKKLSAPAGQDQNGQRQDIFRDSLIENIIELCNLLPKLNLTNDPNLERMRQEVENRLCNYDPDALRKNPELKNEAAKNAAELVNIISEYMP